MLLNWIKFGNSALLPIVWFIFPLCLLVAFGYFRKQQLYRAFSHSYLLPHLTQWINFRIQKACLLFLLLAYLFLSFALAQPQIGTTEQTIEQKGLDLVIALDLSTSMLAEDIKPNRLLKAKHGISQLVSKLQGDRVGLVAFAGSSFVQCPLTTDYEALRTFLLAFDVDTISQGGTEFRDAIETAMSVFDQDETKYKVLIFFSDGEDHGKEAIETAKIAHDQGVRIFCVGLGSSRSGSPIPVVSKNKKLEGYKRGQNGNLIVTTLNDKMLQDLALTTGGNYYQATPSGREIKELYTDLSSLEKRKFRQKKTTHYEERFQYFLGLALILLVLEQWLNGRRKKVA
ncbi:TPA: VWA domain-containing protein [Candidatus Poribacteria bacterium]|nr:VWA domain-containing protein [Candidatus Poribacteria bacterium]